MFEAVKKRILFLLVVLTSCTHAKAQKHLDNFLSDVLSINDFKLDTDLSALKKNESLRDNLIVFPKEDNSVLVMSERVNINLLGLQSVNAANFLFKDDKLNYIDFDLLGDPANGKYDQVVENFKAMYGTPITSSVKNNPIKEYTWATGKTKLTLRPNKNLSFSVIFEKNIPVQKKTLWIYNDRSGAGQGLMQLNLPYFEKLLNSNLTISAFEKLLASWKTEGGMNHLDYEFDPKTTAMDIPVFSITYNVPTCEIKIKTTDTTSNIISWYTLEEIKDPEIIINFKKELKDLNFKTDTTINSGGSLFYDKPKSSISVILDEAHAYITIIKDLN